MPGGVAARGLRHVEVFEEEGFEHRLIIALGPGGEIRLRLLRLLVDRGCPAHRSPPFLEIRTPPDCRSVLGKSKATYPPHGTPSAIGGLNSRDSTWVPLTTYVLLATLTIVERICRVASPSVESFSNKTVYL